MGLRIGRVRIVGVALVVCVVGSLAAWAVLARSRPDPNQVWQQAERDFLAGQYAEAEQAVARLAKLRPPTPLDWMLKAQIALARERNGDALEALAHVPDNDRIAPQARLLEGQIELRRDRLRVAEERFLHAIKLDPKLIQAHRELIYIYGVQLRRPELNEQFLRLSELTDLTFDNIYHWCLTRNTVWEPIELIEMMTRSLKADPSDRWSRLTLAESLRQRGHLDAAETVLAPLPESDPEARVIRVRMALDHSDMALAQKLLDEGPQDHPTLARLRGRMALSQHDGATALRAFRAAYAVEPDNRDTLFGLANALVMVGKDDEAAPYLKISRAHDALGSLMPRAATREGRNDPKLPLELGAACEAIHRLPEARAWYKLAIARNPLDAEAQQALFRLDRATLAAKKPSVR